MKINVNEKDSGTYLIAPEGNLDYITSAELDEVVVEVAGKAEKMIIDVSNINYIASAGLRVLLNADDLMSEKGGMALTNVNDYVMDILKMTDFVSVLTIE